MGFNAQINDTDVEAIEGWMQTQPNTTTVAEFMPGPGIQRLQLKFDIDELKKALDECLEREAFQGGMQDQGFAALPLTQRPGQTEWTDNDLSGRYWLRADGRTA